MLATPFEVKECQFEIGFYQSIIVDVLSIYKLALCKHGKHVSVRCSSEMISSGLPTTPPRLSECQFETLDYRLFECDYSNMVFTGIHLPTYYR